MASRRSGNLQVFCRRLAAVLHEVVFDDLVFVQRGESGALDRGDVDEHVPVAALGLDEAVTLGWVEPLDGAFLHRLSCFPRLDQRKTPPRITRATPQTGFD